MESALAKTLQDYVPLIFKHQKAYSDVDRDRINTFNIIQESDPFRFEHGGMLVYDSKALMTSLHNHSLEKHLSHSESPKRLSKHMRNELNKAYNSDIDAYCRMKSYGPSPTFEPEYALRIPDDKVTLKFNSKFESGNLYKAVKLTDYEYLLFLNSDIGSSAHNHWYYFSVWNPRKTSITFKITNMLKDDKLYNSGMKPAVLSTKSAKENGSGWQRDCLNISYTENVDSKNSLAFYARRKYYTLSFTYRWKYENDLVYFAYSIPYTYSELSQHLSYIKENHKNIARVNPLCTSLCGNICEMLTITENIATYYSFEDEANEWGVSVGGRKLSKLKLIRQESINKPNDKARANQDHKKKKGIVLTARVHSGETVSSFMMRGAINFLLSDARIAKSLRKHFVFKIIPMLNPDGVRYGNSRCSLLGVDLNRRWLSPNKILHPTIFYAKKMIEVFKEKHELMMFCDMHGHGKKKNVFMYGCGVKSYDMIDMRRNLLAKVIPHLLNKKNSLFSYNDSRFRCEKSKVTTARIVVYSQFEVSHSYTMEASFFGPKNPRALGESSSGDSHMNESHLETLGRDLCKLCLIFTSNRVYMQRVRNTNEFLRRILFNRLKSLNKPQNLEVEETKTIESSESPDLINEVEEGKLEEEDDLGDIINLKSATIDEHFWQPLDIVDLPEDESDSGGSDSSPSEAEHETEHLAIIRAQNNKGRNLNSPIINIQDDFKMPGKDKCNITPLPAQTPTMLKDLTEATNIRKVQSFQKNLNRDITKPKQREEAIKVFPSDSTNGQCNINRSNIIFNEPFCINNSRPINFTNELAYPRFNEDEYFNNSRRSYEKEVKVNIIREEYLPKSKTKNRPKKQLSTKLDPFSDERRLPFIYNPEKKFANKFILKSNEKTKVSDLSYTTKDFWNNFSATKR
ncbi:unnamed protein product [Blepharisma stoltei]|uniref:Peptidase M14 domain-containing protein n=1 Tax=Blepharisma stoltei TaxID=1481888 RepID=A0AAU9J806_9CILI|nr:unnamed protein product [Blepharisma stoltei]